MAGKARIDSLKQSGFRESSTKREVVPKWEAKNQGFTLNLNKVF
jgi:hypothetical protein